MIVKATAAHEGRPSKEDAVAGLNTKSDKIRGLAKAGYSRAEIADFLGVRYQFVRNVLVNDERVSRGTDTVPTQPEQDTKVTSPAEAKSSGGTKPDPSAVRIETGGRVAIPPELLGALGLRERETVILSVEDDYIRVMSLPASVKRVQAMVRRIVPEGVSLVDELLAERRLEAEREDEHG
jgi:bifunctional DNA-binding transcriptional regulator/antitoxin component of YhaV-PrlF toxin-antitoxin module